MTAFEIAYLAAEPFLPPLYGRVRRRLARAVGACPRPARLLDVGGRKSHYTIGLPCRVTVSEIERRSETQRRLHLGLDEAVRRHLETRRSNVERVVIDDMTSSRLPPGSYDVVAAIEVIEHVDRDRDFVAHVARVMRPGGRFVLTTPNGDHKPEPTGDHRRHYRRRQLAEILGEAFDQVEIDYCIVDGRARRLGLRPWSWRRPLATLTGMVGNLVNHLLSAAASDERAAGTCHLLAECRLGPGPAPGGADRSDAVETREA